jgi:hypothetical protein
VSTSTTTASATVTRKTLRHENASSSSPLVRGPIASPTPEIATQTLTAVVRSCGSVNACVTIARRLGRMIAPPTPMITWPAMTPADPVARKTTRLPAPIATVPAAKTARRPRMSPSVPADRTRLATTIV